MLPKPEIYGQKEEKYLNFQKKKIKQMKIEDKKRDFFIYKKPKNYRILFNWQPEHRHAIMVRHCDSCGGYYRYTENSHKETNFGNLWIEADV